MHMMSHSDTPVYKRVLLKLSGNHGSGELGEASEKNLIAFDLFVQSAGLEGMAIDTVGSRHSSLLAIMSAGASRVMSEEELMKVVRTKMPSYYQEDDCHQLIHDFYAKYADSCKPMSRDVIRVNALAEKQASQQVNSLQLKVNRADGNHTVQSSNLQVQSNGVQSSEEDYPEPPAMPEKLPKLVELLISRTPEIYKPAVAHAMVALETCSAESPIASNRCAVSVLASCLPSALPFSIPFSIPFSMPFSMPSSIPF